MGILLQKGHLDFELKETHTIRRNVSMVNLKRIRLGLGLSIREAARVTGYCWTYIHELERLKKTAPPETADKIAEALTKFAREKQSAKDGERHAG